MRLFLDTARMGPACPRASQALCEFAQLAAEDPSLYSLAFLQQGAEVWPESVRSAYPELARWHGIAHLRRLFAESFQLSDPQLVLLAQRTAQLMRLASRVLFRQCEHVLTTDLSWPAWQAILNDEATRHQRRVTQIPLAHAAITERWSASDVIDHLTWAFQRNGCDALFLPAVSNLGVTIPFAELLTTLRATHDVRFVLADAAQAYCQVPTAMLAELADVTLVGCHKWLGAHLPMGVAIARNALVAQQLRSVLCSRTRPWSLYDPLLSLDEQLRSLCVDRFSETVNVTPMLTANAALSADHVEAVQFQSAYRARQDNLALILQCLSQTGWAPRPLHSSLQSAILLAESPRRPNGQTGSDTLQSQLRDHGVALTAYPDGLVRLSIPATAITEEQQICLTNALNLVGP